MTEPGWEEAVASFWANADRTRPGEVLAAARALCQAREDDPAAMYELASAHDFVGDEDAAVPLYERALSSGLEGMRRDEAVIQLASSLRNVGRPHEAVTLLRQESVRDELSGPAQAFLALALHDAGETDLALATALEALAPTLALYGGAVTRYAGELGER